MDAYLDGLLDELVTAGPREAWSDVLRRARRSRRRYTALVAVLAALVLAPAGWAIQRAALSAPPIPPAPPAYQPGDQVWTSTPPTDLTTTTIYCDTIDAATSLLAQLEGEGSPINDVECSNNPAGTTLPSAPAPYQPDNTVRTNG